MEPLHPRPIQARDLQSWLQDDRPDPLLVDVREDAELDLARFPAKVLHWPLSRSDVWLESVPQQMADGRPVVVICHAGVRSHHLGLWLLQQMPELEVWNLEGGIDAWSVHVDSSVPRY
jgi:rhodanese-related sulfurtransferase